MQPVRFPEVNKVWAENQPEYQPLPAYVDDMESVTCWSLDWRDRLRVVLAGCIWLRQLNFGNPLQPQLPQARTPFGREINVNPSL